MPNYIPEKGAPAPDSLNKETVIAKAAGLGSPGLPLETRELYQAPLKALGSVKASDWVKTVIKQDEIDRYLDKGKDFIQDDLFTDLIKKIDQNRLVKKEPDIKKVQDILAKSKAIKTLDLEEASLLMQVKNPETLALMQETAYEIKHKVYNNRIVTFAPLYLSSTCVNSCVYCGFRQENTQMRRRRLELDEVRRETEALARDFGHKRLVVVYGEHPDSDIDYMLKTIDTIYSVQVPTRKGTANIRRVNVNAAPMEQEKLKRLTEIGVGTYQVFQETYNRELYSRLHPAKTLKGNYRWRLYAMHRAMDAGLDDVGLGALFGLGDWRWEVLGLLAHNRDLEAKFGGTGAHTISFPRMEAASNAPYVDQSPHTVQDEDFLNLITLLRLCVPHTGLICTAREPAWIRDESLKRGVTQMDASSRIGLGAYSAETSAAPALGTGQQALDNQQFLLGDTRSLEELIGDLAIKGHITSFCTAGYRIGRTGDRIMRLLRDCSEGSFCKLNAVITFREWLDDFAGPEVKALGEELIQKELAESRKELPQFMNKFEPLYEKTSHGCRDLYL